MARTSGRPIPPRPPGVGADALAGRVGWRHGAKVLWRFGRPHTIVGTTASVVGLYAIVLAAGSAALALDHLLWVALTWLAALGANLFIVGLNQITDLPIDRVNKPYLPIPVGDLRFATAQRVVVGAAAASTLAGWTVGPALLATVSASMIIGVAYSLPPLRLKRFAAWAALSIALVRGPLVNGGVYAALAARLFGAPATAVPAQVWLLAAVVAVFSLGIAVAKDITDIAGDRRFAIGSLAVRAGPGVAFAVARALISLAYLGVIALAVLGMPGANGLVLGFGHLALLAALWLGTARTRPTDVVAMAAAYTLIWRLFYAEYLVYPLACVLA